MSIELTVMSLDFDSDEPPLKQVFHKDEVSFGRSDDNDIVLPGEEVSTSHAKLSFEQANGHGPKLFITDLGSVNGTLVDNIPLEPHKRTELNSNQRILISGYLIKPKAVERTESEVISQAPQASTQQNITVDVEEAEPELPEKQAAFVLSADESTESLSAYAEFEADVVELENDVDDAESDSEEESLIKPANLEATQAEEEDVSTLSTKSFTTAEHSQVGDSDVIVFDFEAKKLCSISVSVNYKGLGLSDVNVSLGGQGSNLSNANGLVDFSDIEEGSKLEFNFAKAGYVLEPSKLALVIEDDQTIKVSALKLVSVRGKVQHRGMPLAGVKVNGGELGSTTTNAEGIYEFKNVVEGTPVNVSVEKEGFVFSRK